MPVKISKLYKNWFVHNTVGHPLMGVCQLGGGMLRRSKSPWLHLFADIGDGLGNFFHDATMPPRSYKSDKPSTQHPEKTIL